MPSQFTLIDIRREVPHSMHADKIKVNSGALEINGLAAGDYLLQDHEAGQRVRIVVADAKEYESILAAKHRVLQDKSSVADRHSQSHRRER